MAIHTTYHTCHAGASCRVTAALSRTGWVHPPAPWQCTGTTYCIRLDHTYLEKVHYCVNESHPHTSFIPCPYYYA